MEVENWNCLKNIYELLLLWIYGDVIHSTFSVCYSSQKKKPSRLSAYFWVWEKFVCKSSVVYTH